MRGLTPCMPQPCTMLQEVNISEPGSEPSISEAVPEDMRLLGAELCDKKGMPSLMLMALATHCLGLAVWGRQACLAPLRWLDSQSLHILQGSP